MIICRSFLTFIQLIILQRQAQSFTWMGRDSPLCEIHDFMKDITTWVWENNFYFASECISVFVSVLHGFPEILESGL